ncbi:hypothetical protein C1Y23_25045 [Pseudomonas sp. GW460-12]|nr:hypothetical protein C1Y23_25045 [Pseudomonas sp. GW460-12]PMX53047.1 hypothetical protein C1Y17_15625 [Pseudomonas sp. MPR-R2A6]PMX90121.1 hypothetical protein C1Y21_17715 [Pseudomonas sp. MPR-R2A3]PNA77719.1 hypothetical protein C1Y19_07495 [Pseudomonas sp. MPR-LB3]
MYGRKLPPYRHQNVGLPVGASWLAKIVNDDAGNRDKRGVCDFFASQLAPTGGGSVSLRRADSTECADSPGTSAAQSAAASVHPARR